jgi:hypothetical protein
MGGNKSSRSRPRKRADSSAVAPGSLRARHRQRRLLDASPWAAAASRRSNPIEQKVTKGTKRQSSECRATRQSPTSRETPTAAPPQPQAGLNAKKQRRQGRRRFHVRMIPLCSDLASWRLCVLVGAVNRSRKRRPSLSARKRTGPHAFRCLAFSLPSFSTLRHFSSVRSDSGSCRRLSTATTEIVFPSNT